MRLGRGALTAGGTAAVAVALAAGVAVAGDGFQDRSKDVEKAIDGGKAKNVILLIGDGMAESELTIARNYERGAGGRFDGLDDLPLTGDKTTFSVQEDDPDTPDYDPESASTATHWSTGKKTSDGRISTLPGVDDPDDDAGNPKTVLERAKRAGLLTGVVTTSRLTDATPAGPMSHVPSRRCEGPQNMNADPRCQAYRLSEGGPGSIAEQSIENPMTGGEGVDVLLGGGAERYDQATDEGPTVAERAEELGYEVVRNRDEMNGVGDDQKVLGLLNNQFTNDGNLEVEWDGQPAQNPATGGADGQRCNEDNPARPDSEPTLEEMTDKALRQLSGDKGFFLQVEGSSIDKRSHGAEPCEQIGETVAFDRAVEKALEFARRDDDTLVIVTGDHAHSGQIVENTGANPPGCTSRLRTDEDATMTVTYGTNFPCPRTDGSGNTIPLSGASQQHTGGQIRIAAEGPKAANFVGLTDDTEMYEVMVRALDILDGGGGDGNAGGGSADDDDGGKKGNGRGGNGSGGNGKRDNDDGGGGEAPASGDVLGVMSRNDCGLFRRNLATPGEQARCAEATRLVLAGLATPTQACLRFSARRARGYRRSDRVACLRAVQLAQSAVLRMFPR